MKKKAVSVLLALWIAVSLFSGIPAAYADDDSDVCGVIAEGIGAWEEEIELWDYNIGPAELEACVENVFNDHPEFFYVTGFNYESSDDIITVLYPRYDSRFRPADAATFQSVCTSIINGMPEGTTEERLLYLHDYLVTHCEYDTTMTKRSAYDCLVLGSAVCDGYSRAFLYLCRLARLDVHFIVSEDLDHSWNVARVKNSGTISSSPGSYYYIDCTWDDPSNIGNLAHCGHTEFLISKTVCMEDHPTSDWIDEESVNAYAFYDTDNFYETGNYGWWKNLNRPVQWIGSLMCYAKKTDRSHVFFRSSGSTAETAIALPAAAGDSGMAVWRFWNGATTYADSFITVASLGGNFYFSTPTQIWKLTTGKQMDLAYTLSAAEQARGYLYAIRVRNGNLLYDLATSPDEGPVYTGVLGGPAATHPADVTAAAGGTAAFKVTATGASAYQWQVSTDGGMTWVNSGANGNKTATLSFTATSAHNGYLVRCMVTGNGKSLTTGAAKLTVTSGGPVITTQPMNVTAAAGAAATFKVVASGAASYQWQASTNGGATWANSGANGNKTATLSFAAAAAHNGYLFRCVVTGGGKTVVSNAAKLTVTGAGPTITTQPTNVTAAVGAAATFKVAASGAASYQWQASTNGGATWVNSGANGNKTATLSFTAAAAHSGYLFRCVVTGGGKTMVSNAAKLTVSGVTPTITVQPTNVTAAAGAAVTFKIVASGAVSYQWQVSTDGGATWKNSGANGNKTAILSFTAATAHSGYLFRCVVTGGGKTAVSNTVKIIMK